MILGRVKLDNTLLTCGQSNFNQVTAWSRNRTLVTVVGDTCATTEPPAPAARKSWTSSVSGFGRKGNSLSLIFQKVSSV